MSCILQAFLDFLLKTYTITVQAVDFSNKDEKGKNIKDKSHMLLRHGIILHNIKYASFTL